MPNHFTIEQELSPESIKLIRGIFKEEIKAALSASESEQELTIAQLADKKGVCRKTIRNWAARGDLKGTMKGGRLVFKLGDITNCEKYKHL